MNLAQSSLMQLQLGATGLFGGLPGGGTVGDNTGENIDIVANFIGNVLTILMVVVVLFGIVYAIFAGLKYIRSEGASDQVEEAQNAIKNVFIGLLVAFVGVILVVIISNAFGVDSETGDGGAARQALEGILCPTGGCDTPPPAGDVM